MNSDQIAVFDAATGGKSPGQVSLVIASIIITLFLLWVAWIAWGNFRSWHTGSASTFDMLWSILRAAILLSVLGFYIRP